MSYGIQPFAVKLMRVRRAFGSRDAALVAEITGRFDWRFEQDDCEEDEPTLEVALHETIEERPLRDGYEHKYGYVVELLCWHYGTFLPNEHFMGIRHQWAEEVDRGLIRAGVPEEVFGLRRHRMFQGSPVDIPSPDDLPSIGYLTASEGVPALRSLRAADRAVLDTEVGAAAVQLTGWLETCSRSACDFCFYH